MKKSLILVYLMLFSVMMVAGQSLSVAINQMSQAHPRVLTTPAGKAETLKLVKKEPWAKKVYDGLKQRTDKYVDHGPEWLSSRLAMFWKSHATDVYIKGEYYDHAGGNKAPEPTVMFNGARSHATNYGRPSIENRIPYAEDDRGILLPNNNLEGKPNEYVVISKSGNQVAAMNMDILNVARDAAFLYWLTDEKKYAEVAAQTFDVYMAGIYYRNVPVDLNHGHQQTLVGMTTFEVIHEDAISALVPLYDFLYDYLKTMKPQRMAMYAAAFKKWADNIIDNGVPHNNWNLIQAHYIMDIALALEKDQYYADGKGCQYYLNVVLNADSIRQWGLKKLADVGFDPNTGIWSECPGYSLNVVNDYVTFISLFDRVLGVDMLPQFPIIEKAVSATPQYLFPNRMTVGFGDTHPSRLKGEMFLQLIQNAQKYGKKKQEQIFTAMLRQFAPDVWTSAPDKNRKKTLDNPMKDYPVAVNSFFANKPVAIDKTIPAAQISDYVTPSFYSPNVSWLVQRNGMDKENSLMVSLNASLGNHQHANGLSMELYGRGYPLAPDAGIGLSLYSGQDYLEYYSQFPSHNTVCVDGVSSYPVMMSNHAFNLIGCYPNSGEKLEQFSPITYSQVAFREPETQANQNRLLSIVTTSPDTGYYIDIFRSRRSDGKDKTHDYFYHNLGQNMSLSAADGTELGLKKTEELAFAGGHLYAYSYLFDKQVATTTKDIKSVFTMNKPDGNKIRMTMWQKGETNREVFSALSPMCEGLSRVPNMPYSIKKQPTLTYVARQKGEAWTHPFVSIFEPGSSSKPGSIASVEFFEPQTSDCSGVGIAVTNKTGRTDYILSMTENTKATYHDLSMTGDYAVVEKYKDQPVLLFLGNGTTIQCGEMKAILSEKANLVLEKKGADWYITNTASCSICLNNRTIEVPISQNRRLVFSSSYSSK